VLFLVFVWAAYSSLSDFRRGDQIGHFVRDYCLGQARLAASWVGMLSSKARDKGRFMTAIRGLFDFFDFRTQDGRPC